MNNLVKVNSGERHNKDLVLNLFVLYVTPLCVYLQSMFFATTNIWAAAYISLLCGLMLTSRKFNFSVNKWDSLFFLFLLYACYASLRTEGGLLYFMQTFLIIFFVFGYTKYQISDLYRSLDILFVFGSICAVGCIIQELWNGFYTDIVAHLFKSEDVDVILRLEEEEMGNCGLMPQTGSAAECILNALYILLLKHNPRKKKVIWGSILFLGLLLTGKRAHLFMGMFALFLSFFVGFEGKRRTNKALASVITAVVLVGGLLLVAPFLPEDNTIAKVVNTFRHFDLADEDIMHGRALLFTEAILMGNSAPLIGHGWGSYKKTVDYHGLSTDAHNIYLQLYAEVGLIVLSIFVLAAVLVIINNIKTLKQLRRLYPENSQEVILAKLAFCFILFFYLYGLSGNGLYNIECLITLALGVSINKRLQQVVEAKTI
ncbi:O-antigen ligase [Prevotella sp. MA2016]|uniref:O-antigen ligase family protein n=1 Tax=Prevotella sp. MA2016 TaxID=1408310 RepID=UPI0018CC045C|nr:O-antigen ligase family protein [Prevotella sp. MA2016]